MGLAAPETEQEKHDAELLDRGLDAGVEWAAEYIEGVSMSSLLLAMGEMTAQERRTCKALQSLLARKLRDANN